MPILSNVLIDANGSKLTITATDLDLIFVHKISNVEIFTSISPVNKSLFIEVEKKQYEAILHVKPLHDPENVVVVFPV